MKGEAWREIERRVRACIDTGDFGAGATEVIRGYGPAIFGYLVGVLRDEERAKDAFSAFAERLWSSIRTYRGEVPFRSFAYRMAWCAALDLTRDAFWRRGGPLEPALLEELAAVVRESTAAFRKTAAKEALGRLKESLDSEERSLLLLRIDDRLSWEEIALVMSGQGESFSAPTLRKRFERLKTRLRELARAEGLLPDG